MYKKREYVIYGSSGVCQVGDVTTLDIDNVPKDREYYVLFPKDNGGTIYVPVDVASNKMRDMPVNKLMVNLFSNFLSRVY